MTAPKLETDRLILERLIQMMWSFYINCSANKKELSRKGKGHWQRRRVGLKDGVVYPSATNWAETLE